MRWYSTPRFPDKLPWTISNAPTCSSSPWTTSGSGIAITTSLQRCCGSDCAQRIASSTGDAASQVNALHLRASVWYEAHGLELEAFHHAAAAQDVERAERLMEGKGIPLHFRGAMTRSWTGWRRCQRRSWMPGPGLWVRYASLLLVEWPNDRRRRETARG